ncbi:hypothetical protein VPHK71_0010 [Vibrio phage K71]
MLYLPFVNSITVNSFRWCIIHANQIGDWI